MFDQYVFTAAERFCRYVQFDTQSDPLSTAFPSTEKQKLLSQLLVNELLEMGIIDAHLDDFGYVYATIPATTNKSVPVICFCAHVDTAPDCSGTGVKPLIHKHYNGADIVLPDDTTQVILLSEHPYLKNYLTNLPVEKKTLLNSLQFSANLQLHFEKILYIRKSRYDFRVLFYQFFQRLLHP